MASGTEPRVHGLQGVNNFAVRYFGASVDPAVLAGEYAAIRTDMIIMEATTAQGGTSVTPFLPAHIDQIRRGVDLTAGTADDKMVIAYISIGTISTARARYAAGFDDHAVRDQNNNILYRDSVSGLPTTVNTGEAYLRFADAGALTHYKLWIDELVTQGFDGAFLDVAGAYITWRDARPGVYAAGTAEATMRLVVELAAYARSKDPDFEFVLGHAPGIIADYIWADGIGNNDDAALIRDFRAAIDAFTIETTRAGGLDLANPVPGSPADYTLNTILADPAYNFGDATALAIGYANNGNVAAYAAAIAAAGSGFIPYTTPVGDQFNQTHLVAAEEPVAPATGGHDTINGSAQNDRVYGLAGNDTVTLGAGDDVGRGGSGIDRIYGGSGHDLLAGDAGSDVLAGDAGHDVLLGGDDHDELWGGSGDDRLAGEAGGDVLVGGDGADRFDGGAGDDWLYADAADTSFSGGTGFDRLLLTSASGQSAVLAASGIELVWGTTSSDTIDLTANNIVLNGPSYIIGDAGADVLRGSQGVDVVIAGLGADQVFGNGGNDWLYVEAGDTVNGGQGFDRALIGGTTGVSNLNLSAAEIEIFFGSDGGNDIVHNSSAASGMYMLGQAGNDRITGGAGTDLFYGGLGADILDGGAGNDHLWGGDDAAATAGDGADEFRFRSTWGADHVWDWQDGLDRLAFSVSGVTSGASLGYSYDATSNISTFWYGASLVYVHGLADRADVTVF